MSAAMGVPQLRRRQRPQSLDLHDIEGSSQSDAAQFVPRVRQNDDASTGQF